jgi:hypothetical protein
VEGNIAVADRSINCPKGVVFCQCVPPKTFLLSLSLALFTTSGNKTTKHRIAYSSRFGGRCSVWAERGIDAVVVSAQFILLTAVFLGKLLKNFNNIR